MKTKKTKLFIVVTACLVAVAVVLSVFLIRGCRDQNDESGTDVPGNTELSNPSTNTPGTSTSTVLSIPEVEQLLENVIVQETFAGDELPLSSQYANAVVNSMTYEILSVTQQSTAIVKFKYVDVLKMADGYKSPDDNPDEFYSYCIEKIEKGTAPTVVNEVEVILEFDESDGTYNVVSSIELADALTGGIASKYLDIFK